MLIFANGVGRLTVIPSQLNQNSNRANTIYLTGAFPSAAVVTLAFTLPDGTHTEPQLMTGDKTVEYNGEKFIVREYTIPKNITQVKGRATVQFFITSNNGEETLATEATDITIAAGVPALTPAAPTESVYEQILNALSSIQTEFTNKLDKVTGATPNTLLYAKDKSGNQIMEVVDEAVSGQSIPRRSADGTINVAAAKNEDDAVNLQQMLAIIAEALVVKLDKSGGTISGDLEVGGDFVVKGDFTAQGKTFIEDATTLAVKNAIIETNAGKIDLKTLLSGLVINKSPDEAYGLVYDPTDDTVKFGKGTVDATGKFTFDSGEGSPITTRADSKDLVGGNLVMWDSTKKRLVDAGSRPYIPRNINTDITEHSVTYDTTHGMQMSTLGEVVAHNGDTYEVDIMQKIPIFPGAGIIIDQLDNEYKVVIKVDDIFVKKVTNTEASKRVYTIDKNGDQITTYIDDLSCQTWRLAIYGPIEDDVDLGERQGTLFCPVPKFNYQTANKKYVDDNFIPVKQISSGPFQIPQIGYNKEVNWLDCNVSISPLSLAQRSSDGILYINPPDTVPENVSDYAAVNVGYANKTYVKAINVTENTFVYAASSEGPNGRLKVAHTVEGGIVVQRTNDGNVLTGTPTNYYDAVNLQYFNANALTANSVKTLFGNQSIVGSGNIDLYNHDIEITGLDDSIPISIEFNRVSSKNLVVNSINDLITLLGNEFRISVSGYNGEGGLNSDTIRNIHMLSTIDGGGYLSYHIGSEEYAVANITNLTITDTVTTV